MCGGASVYEPFGRSIKGNHGKVYFQLHFGAIYNKNGEYGCSRDIGKIRSTFERELEKLGTDYVGFGFLHCVDEESDFDEIIKNGKPDCICELKARGIVHHIGFSSHAPSVANKVIDTGLVSK